MMSSKVQSSYECCMCGDLGLSHELFRCKFCHFRSQHRYCSNLYPKADSYRVCNWCLIQKDDPMDTATTSYDDNNNNINNSSNSSSPDNHDKTTPLRVAKKVSNHHSSGGGGSSASPKCLRPTSPIKKPSRPSEGGSPSGRKRMTAQAQQEEKVIRRTRSEEIGNGSCKSNMKSPNNGAPAVIKHVFRNKVRRYKLLDEVSS